MLAAYRKLNDQGRSGKIVIQSTFALIIMILFGINFDLRIIHRKGQAKTASDKHFPQTNLQTEVTSLPANN